MPRLPAGLKKRLQASIENLTPKEVGKLLLIYWHDRDRKNGSRSLDEYPPIQELRATLRDKVERTRGKADHKAASDAYNALVFANYLLVEVNLDGFVSLALGAMSDFFKAASGLRMLLYQDTVARMIGFIREDVFGMMPMPLSRQDFARLQAWGATCLVDLWTAADHVVAHDDSELSGEDEGREMERVFNLSDALAAKLRAGEMAGGDALDHLEVWSPVLIKGGKLPAWAVLRVLWRQYLEGQDYRIGDREAVVEDSPAPVRRFFDLSGRRLEGEDLKRVALAFYKVCRRRPWGKTLVAKPDPDALVKLLTVAPNPFLHIDPVDLGLVDWEAFSQGEKNPQPRGEPQPFESSPAATWDSIRAALREIEGRDVSPPTWFDEEFYPVDSPYMHRHGLGVALRMMDALQHTRQPFTYGYASKGEGELSLSELLGVNFLTPLEENVRRLQGHLHFAASMREALRLISDRYFDGIPVLMADTEDLMTEAESYLREASDNLAEWVDKLKGPPWDIDTTSLEMVEPEPDDDIVDQILENVVGTAKTRSGVGNADALFGIERKR